MSAVKRSGSSSSSRIDSRTRLVSGTSAVGISQKPSAACGTCPPPPSADCRCRTGTLVAHQERRRDLRVAVLGRVQVDHELAERPLEPRDAALENHEARAGELRGRLEIHQAEGLADLEMLLRAGEVPRVAEAVALDVAGLVRADRHLVLRQVRDDGERLVERLRRPRAPPARAAARSPSGRRPRPSGFGPRLVLGAPWPGRSPWRGRCGAPGRPAGRRWRLAAASSRAIRRADSGSIPRLRRPWSNAAAFSRMKRMSCMRIGPCCAEEGFAAAPVRRLALVGRRARGLGFRALPLDHADGEDGRLVKKQGGHRKGELADDVGRRQHGRDHEHEHDGVAALRLEERRNR